MSESRNRIISAGVVVELFIVLLLITFFNPAFIAIPFPGKICSGCRITVAPALIASSTVLSLEYASTTRISGLKLLFDATDITPSMVLSSFLVGNITVTFGVTCEYSFGRLTSLLILYYSLIFNATNMCYRKILWYLSASNHLN
jgi:hypothetical protein